MFKRLYNWLKLKTLPSSILFKNRLFVERDSKHRRIMSNFGLTFRNSKWSDYAIKNITDNSITSFARLVRNFITLIILISLIFSHSYYYNYSIIYNNIAYLLWSFLEDTNYFLAYSFWSLTFTVSFFIHTIYNSVFATFYDIDKSTNMLKSTPVLNEFLNKSYKAPKDLRSPIFVAFLTNSKNSTNQNTLLENLFHTETPNHFWNNFNKSFKNLYSTSYNLSNFKTTFYFNSTSSVHPTLDLLMSDNLSILNNDSCICNNTPLNLTTDTNKSWNLYSFYAETNRYNNLITGKKNLFYLNNLNFNTLSNLSSNGSELLNLSQSLIDQTKVIKWNRWLYRYNILHRKTIKNSHKLTMVKKLISTGFYDTSLMSNNVWASSFFSKTSKSLLHKPTLDLLHFQFNLLYKDTFTNKQPLSNNFNELNLTSPNNPLNMLSYFEKSYFWFVKRFYLFNTLNTNSIASGVTLNQPLLVLNNEENLGNTYNKHFLILSNLVKSPQLTNGTLNPNYFLTNFTNSTSLQTNLNYKDLTLVVNDLDTFNVDNLEILSNISNLNSTIGTDLVFFNFNLYSNKPLNTKLNFINSMNHSKVNTHLTTTFLNSDFKLLTDLYILMLLQK